MGKDWMALYEPFTGCVLEFEPRFRVYEPDTFGFPCCLLSKTVRHKIDPKVIGFELWSVDFSEQFTDLSARRVADRAYV